jgi:small-conductance mechanosensitive channel
MQELWQRFREVVAGTLGIAPSVLDKIALTVFVLAVAGLMRKVLSRVVERRLSDVTRRYVVQKTVGYVVSIVVVLLCLRVWLGGVTGLVAYFGLLSAGLAIALQDPVVNLVAWMFITTRKPFVVGDRIQIGEHAGDVIDFRLFQFSVVEIGNWVDADQSTGRIIHIPNGAVFKQPLANYTQGFNFIWDEIPVTVTFESNWEKAKQILSDIAERHTALKSDLAAQEVRKAARQFMIFFQQLTPIVWTSVADIGVTLTIRYLCEPRRRRSSAEKVWEDILRAFAAEDDIDFAYPTTRFYNNVSEGKPGARAGVDCKAKCRM